MRRNRFRRTLWWVMCGLVVAYLVAPLIVLRVPQGVRSLAIAPKGTSLPIPVFASRQSPALNKAVRIVFYPGIRAGEACGLIEFIHDARLENARTQPLGRALLGGG